MSDGGLLGVAAVPALALDGFKFAIDLRVEFNDLIVPNNT